MRSWLRRSLAMTPVAVDPCKEAFHDPALGMDGKADLAFRFADDLDADGLAAAARGPW